MRFDIMTLFPEMVEAVLSQSIIGRARGGGLLEIHAHNIRDWSKDKHHRVDDTPYGGGMGMLMAAPPVCDCFDAVCAMSSPASRRVIYMSPKGKVLTQKRAAELTAYENIIILCGHYEGVDCRAVDAIADEELSIGDYVLTGGELPACVLVDCVGRMLDGVLASSECYENESIASGLLEYPQYTRPYEFRGVCVPDVLLSGNHAMIERWRRDMSLRLTAENRPELLDGSTAIPKKESVEECAGN